jgi:hypothetical protein
LASRVWFLYQLIDANLGLFSTSANGGGVAFFAYVGGFLFGLGATWLLARAGRMESWQKWSFPFSPPSQNSGDPAGWRPVRKRRRISRFSPASGPIVARTPGPGQQPRCEVELTEVHANGQDWWTLGFEATGPASLLRSTLQATAALVFAQALPGGVKPGPDESSSYAKWLSRRECAESDADT